MFVRVCVYGKEEWVGRTARNRQSLNITYYLNHCCTGTNNMLSVTSSEWTE